MLILVVRLLLLTLIYNNFDGLMVENIIGLFITVKVVRPIAGNVSVSHLCVIKVEYLIYSTQFRVSTLIFLTVLQKP